MRRAWLSVAVVGAAACAGPAPLVDGPIAPPPPPAPSASASATPVARWPFPEANVKRIGAMLRAMHLVEEAITLAVKAWGKTKSVCPSSEPIPSTLPTATSVALADPTSFSRDPGWRCVGFKPTGKLEFQFEFSSDPPFEMALERDGEVMFQACAEAELVPGGGTTVVCWSAFGDPVTGEPRIADRADLRIEPFDPDDSPMPEAAPDANPTDVCRRLAAIHAPRTCEADLQKKLEKNPEDFACFAGCSTLGHVDDQAYCVERCVLRRMPGRML